MANLLYLVYDMDFSEYIKTEDWEKAKLRIGAVRKYIDGKIAENDEKIKGLEQRLEGLSTMEVDSNGLQARLNEVRRLLNEEYEKHADLNNSAMSLSEKIEADIVLIERMQSLSFQYKTDLERLDFIASGMDEMNANAEEHECPYCHSKVREEVAPVDLDSIKSEMEKALHNFNDVSEALAGLLEEHERDERELENCRKKIVDNDEKIRKLIKKRCQLEESLKKFNELIECQMFLEHLQSDNEGLRQDLLRLPQQMGGEKKNLIPEAIFKNHSFRE